jgi:enolase
MLSGAATGEDEAVKLRNSEQRRYGVETFQALKRILAAKVYATSAGNDEDSYIRRIGALTRRSNE